MVSTLQGQGHTCKSMPLPAAGGTAGCSLCIVQSPCCWFQSFISFPPWRSTWRLCGRVPAIRSFAARHGCHRPRNGGWCLCEALHGLYAGFVCSGCLSSLEGWPCKQQGAQRSYPQAAVSQWCMQVVYWLCHPLLPKCFFCARNSACILCMSWCVLQVVLTFTPGDYACGQECDMFVWASNAVGLSATYGSTKYTVAMPPCQS